MEVLPTPPYSEGADDFMPWKFSVENLDAFEFGARLCASGGAGDTFAMSLLTRTLLERSGGVTIIEAEVLRPGDVVIPAGLVGSVMAFAEKPGPVECFLRSFRHVAASFPGRRLLVSAYEMAGINAYAPLLIGAALGIPVADLDGMGRAAPGLDMTTFALGGISMSPCVLVDSSLRLVRLEGMGPTDAEHSLRLLMEVFGGWAAFAGYGMDGDQAYAHGIPGSLARTLALGRQFERSQAHPGLESETIQRFCASAEGVEYAGRGRVIDVRWEEPTPRLGPATHARGTILIQMQGSSERIFRIEAQSEFLLLIEDGAVRAAVPTGICLLDSHTGKALLTESIVPGYSVDVVLVEAPPQWRTRAGRNMLNPIMFGYRLPEVESQ